MIIANEKGVMGRYMGGSLLSLAATHDGEKTVQPEVEERVNLPTTTEPGIDLLE